MKIDNKTRFLVVTSLIEHEATSESPITSSKIKAYFKENYDTSIDARTIKDIVNKYNEGNETKEIIRVPDSNPASYYFNESDGITVEEARLMIDVISSSKFLPLITKKRMIDNISSFFYKDNKLKLQKTILLHTIGNESIESFYKAYSILIDAIAKQKQISFIYERTVIEKKKKKKNVDCIPLETYYTNNTLYLYALDIDEDKIKSYRIDYIQKIQVKGKIEVKEEIYDQLEDMIKNNVYAFSSNDLTLIELTFENYFYANIIDMFGKDLPKVTKVDDHHSALFVSAPISSTFYSWIVGFGGKIKITSPKEEVIKYHQFLDECK